jgi:hypothetical protein
MECTRRTGKKPRKKATPPATLTGGCSYVPSGKDCAQGTAYAPHGPLDGFGCPGPGMRLPGHALALGTRMHFALPLTVEFRRGV